MLETYLKENSRLVKNGFIKRRFNGEVTLNLKDGTTKTFDYSEMLKIFESQQIAEIINQDLADFGIILFIKEW